MKDNNHYKLSANFKNLIIKKNQKQQRSLEKQPKQSPSKQKVLYKLNPKAADPLLDIPVQIMKKKSKNKLQSLKDEKFSIFNIQKNQQPKILQKSVLKKKGIISYQAISNSLMPKNKNTGKLQNSIQQQKQEELPTNIVQPSVPKKIHTQSSILQKSSQNKHTIFQTPLLPCFSSQFSGNQTSEFKNIKKKQGVWRIGKIKFQKQTAKMILGGIQFQAHKAQASGKIGSVMRQNFYQLPNWNGIWVAQPKQDLYIQNN